MAMYACLVLPVRIYVFPVLTHVSILDRLFCECVPNHVLKQRRLTLLLASSMASGQDQHVSVSVPGLVMIRAPPADE